MQRVLYIQDHLGLGGISTVSAAKQNWLVEYGYDVRNVFTHYTPRPEIQALYDNRIRHYGISLALRNRVLAFPFVGRLVWFVYFRVVYLYMLLKINPDVIVSTHMNLEPTLVILFTFWKKRFLEFHISGIEECVSLQIWLRYHIKFSFYKIVCLTQGDADEKQRITGNKALVMPNPITCKAEYTSTCENKRIIIPARFSPQKGLLQFLPYWERIERKHPDWHLYLFGDGEERDAIIKLVAEKDYKNVHVEGYTRNVLGEIADSSMLLMPSMYEGFPTSLVEAMTCGVPCVAFDCKYGPSDIIRNGEDGCLVPFLDYDKFVDRISYLIENPETRKSMGKNAQNNIQRFRIDNIMPQWVKLFNQ